MVSFQLGVDRLLSMSPTLRPSRNNKYISLLQNSQEPTYVQSNNITNIAPNSHESLLSQRAVARESSFLERLVCGRSQV